MFAVGVTWLLLKHGTLFGHNWRLDRFKQLRYKDLLIHKTSWKMQCLSLRNHVESNIEDDMFRSLQGMQKSNKLLQSCRTFLAVF